MNRILMNQYRNIWIVVSIVCILAPRTLSQSAKEHPWWVNLGAGPSSIGNAFSMSGGIQYCYQFEKSIICARVIGLTNNNPTIQKISASPVDYKFTDYGILYGPLWQSGNVYLSIEAGIGLVRAAYDTPPNSSTSTSVSLPLEVQMFWRPTHYAGFGLCVYTSLHDEKNLIGGFVCVQLGVW